LISDFHLDLLEFYVIFRSQWSDETKQ